MPLLLSTPQTKVTTIDRQQIVSFSVDVAASRLYIVYANGFDADGQFVPVGDLQQVTVEPGEFQTALGQHANPSLYSDIKSLLYSLLTANTGMPGTVE